MGKIKLVSGRADPQFAARLAKALSLPLLPTEAKNFANGEAYFRLLEKIRGDDVFLLQTLASPVNDSLVELLVAIDSLKRASAGRINVVCPHLAYSRQDRKTAPREPISARLVADLLTSAGAQRLITVDLHVDQIQGFYNFPVDHLPGYPFFAGYFKKHPLPNPVIVTPDVGGLKKARNLASLLKAPLAIIDKRRCAHNQCEIVNLVGEVKNKNAIIIDDMIDTGGTIVHAVDLLKEKGAHKVYLCASHGLLSGPALARLNHCPVEKIILLDTLPLPTKTQLPKLKTISIVPLLARIVRRIHSGRSLGQLFTWEKEI